MAMSVVPTDCSAKFRAIRSGWTLGVLCGTYSIIVAERDLSEAETALRNTLLPMATLLTPNLPEAEVLVGFPVRDEAGMRRAAERLAALGAKAVLMKGGHLDGDVVVDLLFQDGRFHRFEDRRIASRHTHGTGCTLASATAAGLAQKMSLVDAFTRARRYVRRAIETAPGYGRGHGPLNHAVTVEDDPRHPERSEGSHRRPDQHTR